MQIPLKIAPSNLKRTGLPRINRHHQLANGLKFCIVFENNSIPIEVVTGTVGVPSGGPSPRMSTDGLGAGLAAVSSQFYTFGVGGQFDILGEITLFWRGIQDDTNASGREFFSTCLGGGGTQNPYDFNAGTSAGGNTTKLSFVRANSGFRIWIGQTFSTGQLVSAAFSQSSDISATPTFYYNGVGVAGSLAGGTGTGAPTSGNKPLRVGRRDDGGVLSNGQVSIIAGWTRQLSATEHIMMYLAPYDFLVWPEDDLFSQLVGTVAGATVISLATSAWNWATQSPTTASSIAFSSDQWGWKPKNYNIKFQNKLSIAHWNWVDQAVSLPAINVLAAQAWNWITQGITVINGSTTLALASAAWNWVNQAIIVTGGGIIAGAGLATKEWIIRRRRRS